ncbi:MAG: DNA polymerase IV [Parcubacteria group bacterium]|nr:DNA polymerase IV [Parcubacteria group bacterium]
MGRFILHLDMNSYFASVEQMDHPELRGKPIAVGGSPGTRTIVVAASKEAKRYGVGVGMTHIEARQACPSIQFVDGSTGRYAELTQRFFDFCKRYTDRIEVYSIDEVFLDLTGWVKDWAGVLKLAKRMKQHLAEDISDQLTCSIGAAPNRALAKMASDMQKPDGLVLITENDIATVLDWVEITDMFGIGPRMKIRLADMGIATLKQLGAYPLSALQKMFGPNVGIYLSQLGQGIDHTEVPSIYDYTPTKSMGHTYTLPADTLNRDEVYDTLLRLAEKVGRRLRRDRYRGRHLWVYLRWADFSGRAEGLTLPRYIDDGFELYTLAREILDDWQLEQPVRLVGVGTSMLVQDGRQLSILPQDQRKERLLTAQDKINDRFGERTIRRARVLQER